MREVFLETVLWGCQKGRSVHSPERKRNLVLLNFEGLGKKKKTMCTDRAVDLTIIHVATPFSLMFYCWLTYCLLGSVVFLGNEHQCCVQLGGVVGRVAYQFLKNK